jgi:uncharacterized membrane protein YhaH (DUF805 family)
MSYEPYPTSPYGENPPPPPSDPAVAPLRGATFAQAVQRFFSRYALFRGRASRSEFWWWTLASFIIEAVLRGLQEASSAFGVLGLLYALAVIVPQFALAARRLHDTNRSGWWQLLGLIPIVGWIILIVWFASEEKPAGVRFDA